jgi:tetratricopeptide (TPR) repeat protein
MVVKIITALLLCSTIVLSSGQNNQHWLQKYKNNLDFVNDDSFSVLLEQIVPDTMAWRSFITEYLKLPVPDEEHGPVIIDNRYYTGSGFKEYSMPQRIYFWYDMQKKNGAFAVTYDYENSSEPVYILSIPFSKTTVPGLFENHLYNWLKRLGMKQKKMTIIKYGKRSISLEEEYKNLSLKYKNKSDYISLALAIFESRPWNISSQTVTIYNDLGFFLEQGEKYQEASEVLSEVIAKFPDRIPAYLNLADAYAALINSDKAKENYKKYAELMTKAGKQGKIPKRVVELLKK